MRACRPQTRPHRRPFKGFGLPGSGIWRQLGTGHRSFTAAGICRGGVPDRAGQPEQNLAGIFRASRRRSWGLIPLRSFDPAWRSLASPPSQPTCPQAAHLHRILWRRSERRIRLLGWRSSSDERSGLLGIPPDKPRLTTSIAGRCCLGVVLFQVFGRLSRAGRVSSPWPAIGSGNRFRLPSARGLGRLSRATCPSASLRVQRLGRS